MTGGEKVQGLGVAEASAVVHLTSEPAMASSFGKDGRGKTSQEKRRCPECGAQVGPRYGTGKDGEGSKCPGSMPDGTKCQYIFSAGKRKQEHLELRQQCSATKESKLTEIKAAYHRTSRKVMKEAAKTGASAILLWYNVVEDSTPENKELHRMVRKTSNSEARHIPVPNGEYTFQATAGSGDIQKCAVMFQYNTGTETAKSILERVTNAVNNTALKHLQQEADNAALASTVAGSSEPAAKKTAAPKELEELSAFLKDIQQYDGCYGPLSQNGLTLKIMRAIVTANKGEMPPFVEALKVVGVSAGQAMVLYAHINKL